MEWETIWKTLSAIIISFGGAGAIIVAVTKFSVNRIADSLEKKYELKLSKELETFKNRLENKSYVSKARFDAEFQIYRQLSEITVTTVKEISQLFPTFTRDCRDDYDTYKQRYDLALEKTVKYQDTLASCAPFISADMYSLFSTLEVKCKSQLGAFVDFRLRPDAEEYVKECKDAYKDVWTRTKDIQKDIDIIIEKLRDHLAQLEVME